MSITAWETLAGSVTSLAGADDGTVAELAAALPHLGLAAAERQALDHATRGRADPAGLLLRELVETAPPAAEGNPAVTASWDPAAMDAAIEAADRVRADPGMASTVDLAALPPDRAGDLVLDLVLRGMSEEDLQVRGVCLDAAVEVSLRAPMTRLPVVQLLATAPEMDDATVAALGVVLGQAPRTHVVRGVAAAVQAGTRHGVAALLEAIRWPELLTGAAPPDAVMPDAAPLPKSGLPPPPAAAPPTVGTPPPRPSAPVPPPPTDEPVYRSGGQRVARTAYPRIDLQTGTGRPDVVVVEQDFSATVGLAPRPSRGVVSAGRMTLSASELEVLLVFDPVSLTVQGGTRQMLAVTDADPYPAVTVSVTAHYLEDAPATRRLGVQYLCGGKVVGMAWRSFTAVDGPELVADAPAPPSGERELIDLDPLLEEDPPDLVLAVVASDTAADRWVWTVYSPDPQLSVPDAPNTATLDGDVAGFALATRRAVQYSGDPVHDYYTLTGRARRIGASVPPVVHRALTALLAQPGRATPPSVLLLTEELLVPWELASLDPAPQTAWGGGSAFLGAHVALGRWPLTEHRPRPLPRSTVTVRSAAVVTGDYTGVPGWGRLQHAEAEAQEVAELFTPPATRVGAELLPVIDLLRGRPPADLIHLALHGQFDHQGEEEGIVLVRRDGASAKPQFLTPVQVENGRLDGAFVFLNACQVGADERVLGSYGGFASTLLRIGAGGAVAPLWNVEDKVAADIARRVYADTLGAEAVPVAESVRRIRASYTEEAVVTGAAEGTSATLVAFQVFGHPRLSLRRPT